MVQVLLMLKILFTKDLRYADGLISPITRIFVSEINFIFMVSESVLFLLYIFTFLMYLLKSPVINHWNVM